jgi:hypothetical protein
VPDSKDYRLFLNEKFKVVHTSMNAQFEMINGDLTEIKNHLKEQNGSILELKNADLKTIEVAKEFHDFKAKFTWCKKHWLPILFIVILLIFVIASLTEIIGMKKIVEIIISKST